MSNKEFEECPCCGAEKYGLLQDKIHLDWARECLACGFAIELMPRSASRVKSYNIGLNDEDDEFEAIRAGLHMSGSLETLFEGLSDD